MKAALLGTAAFCLGGILVAGFAALGIENPVYYWALGIFTGYGIIYVSAI